MKRVLGECDQFFGGQCERRNVLSLFLREGTFLVIVFVVVYEVTRDCLITQCPLRSCSLRQTTFLGACNQLFCAECKM